MAYPFTPSFHDYGSRGQTPVLGITVHMAEGGGTVGYLSRQNPNGVSVHYVVEYSGRVVQMLQESDVNGSINPRDIRTTDDPQFNFRGEWITYGATAAKRALGGWWSDPNRATIGIEIEGFAANGPNFDQTGALIGLVNDIRTRFPKAHVLAHRDFADYKACPGKRIDWAAMGGHGAPPAQGDTALKYRFLNPSNGTVVIGANRGLVNLDTGQVVVPTLSVFTAYARIVLDEPLGEQEAEERQKGYAVNYEKQGHLALDDVVSSFTPAPGPSDPASAVYDVIVGGKPVGSVTLP